MVLWAKWPTSWVTVPFASVYHMPVACNSFMRFWTYPCHSPWAPLGKPNTRLLAAEKLWLQARRSGILFRCTFLRGDGIALPQFHFKLIIGLQVPC